MIVVPSKMSFRCVTTVKASFTLIHSAFLILSDAELRRAQQVEVRERGEPSIEAFRVVSCGCDSASDLLKITCVDTYEGLLVPSLVPAGELQNRD